MRSGFSFFVFSFSAICTLRGQDAGQITSQIAQQATMNAQQIAQQATAATLQAQQANDQAARNSAAQMAAAQPLPDQSPFVPAPKFSLKPGTYGSAVTLRLKCALHGAAIYYTTDGWTPTLNSPRYTGPIVISSTANVQAIAVVPEGLRSRIRSGVFEIRGSRSQEPARIELPAQASASASGIPAGTGIPVMFAKPVDARQVHEGDSLPVVLAKDISVGGILIATKLSPVVATVTDIEKHGVLGRPGSITFTVDALRLNNGVMVPLSGTRTLEASARVGAAFAASAAMPAGGLLVRGHDAEIPSGASLTAVVAAPQTAMSVAQGH